MKQLRQAEHAGQLPETDLFTILREWDTASGTALVPLMTENGFSAAIATKTNLSAALSPDAVSGLCWLRGDNYPEQFSTESGSYTVSSAKTQLSAEKLPDGFHVTAAILLQGYGTERLENCRKADALFRTGQPAQEHALKSKRTLPPKRKRPLFMQSRNYFYARKNVPYFAAYLMRSSSLSSCSYRAAGMLPPLALMSSS